MRARVFERDDAQQLRLVKTFESAAGDVVVAVYYETRGQRMLQSSWLVRGWATVGIFGPTHTLRLCAHEQYFETMQAAEMAAVATYDELVVAAGTAPVAPKLNNDPFDD